MSREIKFRAWTGKRFEYDFNMYSNGNAIDIDVPYHLPCRLLKWQLCQFTGLQDKNGQDIYEGDFIKDDDHYYGVVYWCDKSFMWCVSGVGGLCDFCINKGVIGNIYENPELLR